MSVLKFLTRQAGFAGAMVPEASQRATQNLGLELLENGERVPQDGELA